MIGSLRARGAAFATLTHAAGISSTGDAELDRLLPLDEPYDIPASTARLIEACRDRGGRVIAIGTTVVRALEHAARADGSVRPGAGTATQRIGPASPLRCVDAIVSGTHEPGTSHYDLLRCVSGWRGASADGARGRRQRVSDARVRRLCFPRAQRAMHESHGVWAGTAAVIDLKK